MLSGLGRLVGGRMLYVWIGLAAILAAFVLWVYIHTLRGTIASVKAQNRLLEVQVSTLEEEMGRRARVLEKALSKVREIRDQTKEARDELNRGVQDGEGKEWGETRIPDSLDRVLNPGITRM